MQYISGEARKPSIFVSSTCYDLKQIRRDIREFIEADLGYEAILSEYDSFPIDPDKDTINNCLRVVELTNIDGLRASPEIYCIFTPSFYYDFFLFFISKIIDKISIYTCLLICFKNQMHV